MSHIRSKDQTARNSYAGIESKWNRRWEDQGIHHVDIVNAQRPYYNLMMFPYPSAEGLHVGNTFAFVGSDVHGRYMRARGFDVFEPMGFDAFGMHSENYALKTGQHPWTLTPRSIEHFRDQQLMRIGAMFDWRHSIDTTDPGYYRWTQWIFLRLLDHGLAYRKLSPVNWCPGCRTVLANEQAKDGVCERCDAEVESRELVQWFFRITAYADRLLSNLDRIDWSETTKAAQRHWIGRSEGAEIRFEVVGGDPVTVFTTRPDTLFGVTFIAVHPNHPLAASAVASDQAAPGSNATPEAQAIHPLTGERVPILSADYVLAEYGSGVVMGVPAHDSRDFDFAKKHRLPIRPVVVPTGGSNTFGAYEGEGTLVSSGRFTGLSTTDARSRIIDHLESSGVGRRAVRYRLRDWCVSRQRYWGTPIPVVHCVDCGPVPVPDSELPVELPFIEGFEPDGSGVGPLARDEDFVRVACPKCGTPARRETDVCDNFLDSAWFFLRYPSSGSDAAPFSPETTRTWLPVDTYIGGNEHAVLHLMYTRFITMALHDMGYLEFEEPFRRFRAHGILVRNGTKISKSRGNTIDPERYLDRYGADVLRTYLMFFGNYTEGGDFRDENISGVARFIDRVARFHGEHRIESIEIDERLARAIHPRIAKVTRDIEALHYHTAIAALMELLQIMQRENPCPAEAYEIFLRLLAPFAPYISHELWDRLHPGRPVIDEPWPEADAGYTDAEVVEIVVQIDGKLRDRFRVAAGLSENAAFGAAMKCNRVSERLAGVRIVKKIYVPDRLVNFVTKA